MKNIHILPTGKASNLLFEKISNRYYTNSRRKENTKNIQNQNIYITNDEEIKEGDWVITPTNDIIQWAKVFQPDGKKIILTTDQDLIKDGVQTIDDEFLEWFVKNPSCEEITVYKVNYDGVKNFEYKIIIPKEEPKQETLEEAAFTAGEESFKEFKKAILNANRFDFVCGFTAGAKWQQEKMYSKEEVLEIIRQYALEEHLITSSKPDIWFEQFKKK